MTRAANRVVRAFGPLGLVMALFVAAGGFRLADGAVARTTGARPDVVPGETAGQRANAPMAASGCSGFGDAEPLLKAIRERQASLAAREAKIADRLQALKIAEMKLKENREALIDAEKRLAETLEIADSAAESDLARLTTVYNNMKPKDAVGLFAAMAPEFAAGFLARMNPDSSARILAGLSPEQAYSISLILAGRNASAPVK